AVGAGVAAAKHNHVFSVRVEHPIDLFSRLSPVFFCKVIHCPIDPLELPAGDRDLARQLRTYRQANRIKFVPHLLERKIHAYICAGSKYHAFAAQLVDPARNLVFAELEVRYAINHQAADLVVALKDRYLMSDPVKLLCSSESGRAASDNCNTLAGANVGRFRSNPALRPTPVYDCSLDALDCDRVVVVGEDASGLAWRRTGISRKLREIVRCVQTRERTLPVPPTDEIIPVRNDISDWATTHAGWYAAIHAAGALLTQLSFVPILRVNFFVITDAHSRVSVGNRIAIKF